MHALFDDNPKFRYLVVQNRDQAPQTIRAAIKKLVQLNEDQAHTFRRDELVALLDSELSDKM